VNKNLLKFDGVKMKFENGLKITKKKNIKDLLVVAVG